MEVKGELFAPDALPTGKEDPVLMRKEVRWASEPVWMLWKNLYLSLPRIGFRFLNR